MKLELAIILKELFGLKGNHSPEKLLEKRKKLKKFISDEELYFEAGYSEDFEISKDAIHFIDATNICATTPEKIKGYIHMKPLFQRLMKLDTWNYYDIQLFIGSINFITTVEEAAELASKAMKVIHAFRGTHNTDVMEGVLACNMCSFLLHTKYFSDNVKVDLTSQFNSWFSRIEPLEELNYELSFPFMATEIRQALFNQDDKRLHELCEELHEIHEEEIECAIKNEINFYTNSPKYKALQGGEQ